MADVYPQIALLTANGADEKGMAEIGRGLMVAKRRAKMVSPENALLMTWAGSGWGISYPVDARLENSFASDFDALILPSGSKAVEKLLSNPHTRRFVGTMFLAHRAVVAFGDAADLLAKLDLSGDNLLVLDAPTAENMQRALEHITGHVAQDVREAA